MIRRSFHALLAAALPLVVAACDPDLDITRKEQPLGTLGETIYMEDCQRVAYTAQLDGEGRCAHPPCDVSGEIYAPVCQANMPAPPTAPARLRALQKQRPRIVAAVDLVVPKALASPVESFLESLVALADDGTIEHVLGTVGGPHAGAGGLLADMRDDPDLLGALARIGARSGYRPTKAASGLASAVVRYPALGTFLDHLLDVFGEGGKGEKELTALLDAVSHEASAATAVAEPGAKDRTLRLALDLLFTPAAAFGDGTARPLVLRDHRGMALVAGGVPAPFVDKDGDGLPDVDGLGHFVGPDGKPLLLDTPFAAPGANDKASRDGLGRLLGQSGQLVYRYLDLDTTLLGGALHEVAPLLDAQKDDLLGLLWSANALLGPRVTTTRTYALPKGGSSSLTYQKFASQDGALADLGHAFFQILGDPNGQETLLVARALFQQREPELARAIAAMFDANDRGKLHPQAAIPGSSTLYDELVPIIVRTLRIPGLLEDLMDAMQDPHVRGLAPMLARQMLYKDRFVLDQSSKGVIGSWSTQVDRNSSSGDSDWNRSIMQRMAHLVHDANGVRFCNKKHAKVDVLGIKVGDYDECEMFRIDDLGLFFVLSMADHGVTSSTYAHDFRYGTTYSKASFREAIQDSFLRGAMPDSGFTDTLMQSGLMTGITGFARFPSPAAAARSLFLDYAHQTAFMQNTTDPVRCRDGDPFIAAHNDSIFAWETTLPGNPSGYPNDTFYDAIRPLITAYAKHDECVGRDGKGNCTKAQNAAKIFVDLMSVLHEHWASAKSVNGGFPFQSQDRAMPRFSTGDGVVTYEPLLGEVLGKADLVPSVLALTGAINQTTVNGGKGATPARTALHQAAIYLFDFDAQPPEIARRDGSTDARRSDGTSLGKHVTPYYLLAEAFARKRAVLGAVAKSSPAQYAAWQSSTTHLIDQLLGVDDVAGKRSFHDRRFPAITIALLDLLRGRVAAHQQAGDFATWSHKTLTQDLVDVVEGPTFAALGDLVARIEGEPALKADTYALVAYLVDPASTSFGLVLTAAADLLQSFLDEADLVPIAHVLGAATDPARGLTDWQLKMVKRARALDPSCPAKGGGNGGGKECTLVTILRNLFQEGPRGTTPLSDLADAVGEVHRVEPGHGGDLSPADYRSVIDNVRSFLVDESRGFERFVKIVQGRK